MAHTHVFCWPILYVWGADVIYIRPGERYPRDRLYIAVHGYKGAAVFSLTVGTAHFHTFVYTYASEGTWLCCNSPSPCLVTLFLFSLMVSRVCCACVGLAVAGVFSSGPTGPTGPTLRLLDGFPQYVNLVTDVPVAFEYLYLDATSPNQDITFTFAITDPDAHVHSLAVSVVPVGNLTNTDGSASLGAKENFIVDLSAIPPVVHITPTSASHCTQCAYNVFVTLVSAPGLMNLYVAMTAATAASVLTLTNTVVRASLSLSLSLSRFALPLYLVAGCVFVWRPSCGSLLCLFLFFALCVVCEVRCTT